MADAPTARTHTAAQGSASRESIKWVTVAHRASEGPFLLDDGRGQCLVEPARAWVEPRGQVVWHGPWRDPGDRRRQGAMLLGFIQLPVGFGGRFRFTEARITARRATL